MLVGSATVTTSTASRTTGCGLTSCRTSIWSTTMTDTAAVEARIAQIFSTHLHLDIPSVEMDLFETGAIDSLAFVEFLLHLEREFAIKVSLDDLELDNFRTIRRITGYVASRDGQMPSAREDGAHPPARAR